MAEMTEADFLSEVQMLETDAISNSDSYMPLNRQMMEYYLSCPNGYEVEGQSEVTSTEVQDVVGSDMPALVRFFLSGKEWIRFKPNSQDPEDVQQALEKTQYVHHIITNQPASFKIIHDWLKSIEIQSLGAIYYPWKETKKTETKVYKGLDEDEWLVLFDEIEAEAEKQGFEFEVTEKKENDDNTLDLKFKITREKKGVVLSTIPIEQMLISKNAETKDKADLIGHRFMARRGDLKAQGYDEAKLAAIPRASNPTDSGMRRLRFKNQQQTNQSATRDAASDLLVVSILYVMVDFDGDGVPERRQVVKIGNEIFENEAYDHVPYAITSAMLMPNSLIGRSRAEITLQSQLLGTEVMRQTMDNIYDVGAGRVAVDEDAVDWDDLLTNRNQGVVRFNMGEGGGDIRNKVTTLETTFIGDKTLLIMQYLDSKRAASTGEMLANQGLDADKIYNETATRFEGMRDAGAAKMELVARVIAEMGGRDLFEGIAWTVSHFQSTKDEILVLGKPLTINPMRWWTEHHAEAKVGEGAGDDSETIRNLTGIYQIQTQLAAIQSPLSDNKKQFNTLERLLKAMDENQINEFFNDPGQPEQSAQFLLQQNKKLMDMIQQIQSQQANPLAEAEMIEQQGKVAIAQGNLQLKGAELQEKQRQFDVKQQSENTQKLLDLEEKYIALELKFKTDIAGKGQTL